jgi:hypothetical protein
MTLQDSSHPPVPICIPASSQFLNSRIQLHNVKCAIPDFSPGY